MMNDCLIYLFFKKRILKEAFGHEILFTFSRVELWKTRLAIKFKKNLKKNKKVFSLQITHRKSKTTPICIHGQTQLPIFKYHFSLTKTTFFKFHNETLPNTHLKRMI